jgi:hypothetical protein
MPPHPTESANKKAFHSYQIHADLEEESIIIRQLVFHGFTGEKRVPQASAASKF